MTITISFIKEEEEENVICFKGEKGNGKVDSAVDNLSGYMLMDKKGNLQQRIKTCTRDGT